MLPNTKSTEYTRYLFLDAIVHRHENLLWHNIVGADSMALNGSIIPQWQAADKDVALYFVLRKHWYWTLWDVIYLLDLDFLRHVGKTGNIRLPYIDLFSVRTFLIAHDTKRQWLGNLG